MTHIFRHKTIASFMAALMAVTMSSCSDEEYSTEMMLSDIVTVTSVGNDTRFEFQRYDDSPLIKLTAGNVDFPEKIVNNRVLLRYYPESGEPYTSGAVKVVGLTLINNDTTRIRPIEKYNWTATPVYLNSIWRTGNYLNLRMKVEYSEKPRQFGLVVDSLTLKNPQPEVYLVHDKQGQPENYMMETYASFDMTNVWSLPTCQSIKVHVNDTNLKKDIYIFTKKQ